MIASLKPIQILMVEDNPDDVLLTQEALKDGKVHCDLHVVDNGLKGLNFLRRQGEYSNAPRPDIILLDLNLPIMDGREVLAEVKNDNSLRNIPIVVLTTSDDADDISTAYSRHVNCYITKPVDFEQFIKVVKAIEDFWFTVVKLPD